MRTKLTEYPTPARATLEAAERLHQSATRLTQQLRVTRPAGGLSLTKLGVLDYLRRNGATTATTLSEYLGVQPQSLTRLIGDLVRRRFVVRKADARDGRQILLDLTVAGTNALQTDARERRARLAQAMNDILTPAEHDMLRVAATLIDRLIDEISFIQDE